MVKKKKDNNKLKQNIYVQYGRNSTNNYDTISSEYSGIVRSKDISANICSNGFAESSTLSVNTKHHFVPISFHTPSSYTTAEGTFLVVSGTGMATDPKTGGQTSGVFSLLLQKSQIGKKDFAMFNYSGINPISKKNLSFSISKTLAGENLTISPIPHTNRNDNTSESQTLTQFANIIHPILQAINHSLEKLTAINLELSGLGKHQNNEIMDHTITGIPSDKNDDVSSNDIINDVSDEELTVDAPVEESINVTPPDQSVTAEADNDLGAVAPVVELVDVVPPDESNVDGTNNDSGTVAPVVEPVDVAPPDESNVDGTNDDSGTVAPVVEPVDVAPPDESNVNATNDDLGTVAPVVEPVDAAPPNESNVDGTNDDSGTVAPVVEPVDFAPPNESNVDGTNDDSGAVAPVVDSVEDLSDNDTANDLPGTEIVVISNYEIEEDLTVSNTTENLPDLQLVEEVPVDDTKEDLPAITSPENISDQLTKAIMILLQMKKSLTIDDHKD
ncbi:hypothetical protein R4Z09_17780 [Niallia oryzisoli]|uniref:Uncharacterized protein n=1 Tax=Niallia oryzisoli TaxID=1737571 RepID=A0ABZ2C6P0_9BACI